MNPRLCAILLTVLPALAGCFDNTYVKQDRTDRRPRVLAVTDHDGGAHECLLLKDRLWYVGQGPRLLVLEGRGTTVYYQIADPTIYALCDLVCDRIQQQHLSQVWPTTSANKKPTARLVKRAA